MDAAARAQLVLPSLEEERQFVTALGGYVLGIPGADLVTNERVPVPRFNFVQDVHVARDRLAAFTERALDHYFQRALRPTVRVSADAPLDVEAALSRFSFRRRSTSLVLLGHEDGRREGPAHTALGSATRAESADLDDLVAFWTTHRESDELRRALDVAGHHPNPQEEIVPFLAREDDRPIAAALAYRFRDAVGIHGVATQPEVRGQGVASALVSAMLEDPLLRNAERIGLLTEEVPGIRRLVRLGFHPTARYVALELPPEAELALPKPGPPTPPRWRPPRTRPPVSASPATGPKRQPHES